MTAHTVAEAVTDGQYYWSSRAILANLLGTPEVANRVTETLYLENGTQRTQNTRLILDLKHRRIVFVPTATHANSISAAAIRRLDPFNFFHLELDKIHVAELFIHPAHRLQHEHGMIELHPDVVVKLADGIGMPNDQALTADSVDDSGPFYYNPGTGEFREISVVAAGVMEKYHGSTVARTQFRITTPGDVIESMMQVVGDRLSEAFRNLAQLPPQVGPSR